MHSATPTGECRSWNAHASLLCTLIFVALLLSGCGKEAVYLSAGTQTDAVAEESADETGSDNSRQTESDTVGGAGSAENSVGDESTGTADSGAGGDLIYVYVCGAVNSPGLYQLEEGSRVYDAITAAGGLRDDASEDYWNQAACVSDGQMIDVPTAVEVENGLVDASSGTGGSNSGMDSASGTTGSDSGTNASSGTDESDGGSEAGADSDTDSSDRININTAAAEELMQIPGVGEARAQAIISYREQSGGFSAIEDIKNVSGIGDALFEKMKDYIEV